jgi:hypothetical protein
MADIVENGRKSNIMAEITPTNQKKMAVITALQKIGHPCHLSELLEKLGQSTQ